MPRLCFLSQLRVLAALMFLGTIVSAPAQQVGDSKAAVEKLLGSPESEVRKGGQSICTYEAGHKVVFRNGVATMVVEPGAEPDSAPVPGVHTPASVPSQPATAPLMSEAELRRRAGELGPHHVGVLEWMIRALAIAVIALTWYLRRPSAARA